MTLLNLRKAARTRKSCCRQLPIAPSLGIELAFIAAGQIGVNTWGWKLSFERLQSNRMQMKLFNKVSFSIFAHMWLAVGANKTRINCLCKSCFACNSRAGNKIFSNNACWSRTSEQTVATAEWDGKIETSDFMQRRLGTNYRDKERLWP